MVWDVRQKDAPVAKFLPTEGTTGRDCWSVAFGNSYNSEERIVVAGYDNGDIKMYDLKTMSVRWSKCLKNGVSKITGVELCVIVLRAYGSSQYSLVN